MPLHRILQGMVQVLQKRNCVLQLKLYHLGLELTEVFRRQGLNVQSVTPIKKTGFEECAMVS